MKKVPQIYNHPAYVFLIISVAIVSLFIRLPHQFELTFYCLFLVDLILGATYYFMSMKKLTVLGFFRHTTFDILACVPMVYFGYFKIFRLLRLVRIIKLNKIERHPVKFNWTTFFTLHTGRELAIWLMIYLIGNVYIFSEIERMSFLDSVYWMVETVTTVGYGDFYPTQAITKIMTILLMLIGVGSIGYLNGVITNSVVTALNKRNSEETKE